jgi:hypothetical protein
MSGRPFVGSTFCLSTGGKYVFFFFTFLQVLPQKSPNFCLIKLTNKAKRQMELMKHQLEKGEKENGLQGRVQGERLKGEKKKHFCFNS